MIKTKQIKKEASEVLSRGNRFPLVGAFMTSLIATVGADFLVSLILTFLSPVITKLSEIIKNFLVPIICSEMSRRETLQVEEFIPYLTTMLSYLLLMAPFIILLMPLYMGCLKYAKTVVFDDSAPFSEIFCYFREDYFKALKSGTSIAYSCIWRIFLCFIPFSITKSIMTSLDLFDISLDFSTLLCYVILCVLLYISTLISAKLCLKFLPSLFSFLETGKRCKEDDFSVISYEMSKIPFRLFFSLSLWVMLCYLIVPAVFIIPYIAVCFFTFLKHCTNVQIKDE